MYLLAIPDSEFSTIRATVPSCIGAASDSTEIVTCAAPLGLRPTFWTEPTAAGPISTWLPDTSPLASWNSSLSV